MNIRCSTLLLLAFSTAFFSRMLDTAGFPAVINLIHFATVPTASIFALIQTKTNDRKQIEFSLNLIAGLLLLLGVMLASAFWNNAGTVNAVVHFLMLGEPFVLLLGFTCLPLTIASVTTLQRWFVRFCFVNLGVAYIQYFLFMVLGRHPKPGNPDYVQGVFYHSGGGHVVSASVSMTFGLYYLICRKDDPLWLRLGVAIASFTHMLLADAKQVLLVFLVAGGLLLLVQLQDLGKALRYLCFTILLLSLLVWCIQNVAAFDAFNTWMRPEIYGPDGEATRLKFASIRIANTYIDSPLHWLLGLGPGHTVGRLGGWMIRDYNALLNPLGATTHPIVPEVWQAVSASWLGSQSSMFSPFWGWAGIWGDIGLLGLGTYFYLAWIVWHRLCLNDFSKFLLLSVFCFGLVFTQIEEPGYMLFVATLVALQGQQYQVASKTKHSRNPDQSETYV